MELFFLETDVLRIDDLFFRAFAQTAQPVHPDNPVSQASPGIKDTKDLQEKVAKMVTR